MVRLIVTGSSIALSTGHVTDRTRKQFAPHGRLRIGLAFGTTISPVWTMPDPRTGTPSGPAVDFGAALAAWLGLQCDYVTLASSGQIIETADDDRWDVAFTPVDAERKAKVDFTTNYVLGDSTYMVRRDSPFLGVADVDTDGVRVIGVENTATLRSARKSLSRAEARGVSGLDEAVAAFRLGQADAVALGRASLVRLQEDLPESRILPDHFHATGTALAMPHGRGGAIEAATAFIEESKRNGTIEEILFRHFISATDMAPLLSRS